MADLYYIQNRGYCGDCLLWWRANRCGYTMNLDEALKVEYKEARHICASRPHQDRPWLVSEIDALSERHVNSERLRAPMWPDERNSAPMEDSRG